MKSALIIAGALLALSTSAYAEITTSPAANRLDKRGDRIEQRLDNRGDRIENRLDNRGDRKENRMDNRADKARAAGNEQKAENLERKGDRINRSLDRRARHTNR
jgi:exonuclease VII large subunit